jgi:hypothetical protein
MNKRNVSTDATKKIIGTEYQKLIALEHYFQAGVNEIIYLECLGDVANNDISTEVKYHEGKTYLSDCHIDFWKTLYNWVNERDLYSQFHRLILHTTANINETSIFNNWDKKKIEERFDSLKNVDVIKGRKKKNNEDNSEKIIKKYYDDIFAINKDELFLILEKVQLKTSQVNAKEKWEELKRHGMMRAIDESLSDAMLEMLVGHVTHFAIENSNKWHINRNDFDCYFRIVASMFAQKDLPFPTIDSKDINQQNKKFLFVQEIKAIGYNSPTQITQAVNDYLRACMAVDKMLEYSPVIHVHIENHDNEIEETLKVRKDHQCFGLTKEHLSTKETHGKSCELYYNCTQEMQRIDIKNVQPIEPYYQRGRIHSIVEEKEFKWRFTEEDIHETE